jgi:lipoprotein NlpD
VLFGLAGCASDNYAPVRSISSSSSLAYYVVKKGDTLYSIAFRYGYDFRELATINKLTKEYNIYPGQKIFFTKPIDTKNNQSAIAKNENHQVKTKSTKIHKKQQKKSSEVLVPKARQKIINRKKVNNSQSKRKKTARIDWLWPIKGKVIDKFSIRHNGNKGIDIASKKGQTVIAVEAGKVVYSGSGLRGYGNLIIIKHSEDFLSAYAHNEAIFVKENQEVARGQKIALVGNSGTDLVKLHFEIRFKGKPVNPLKYLPKQQ